VPVRKAVIPAAGLGTRFLPASKVVPKEMIPVVDRPGIQYAVEECARAGVDDVLFVTGWGKGSLEDHFDRARALEAHLERTGKTEELELVRRVTEIGRIFSVRQNEPLGLGHAVLQGKDHVGTEPFAVLLPDEIAPEPRDDEDALLERMIEIYSERGARGVIAVTEVRPEEASAYGIAAIGAMNDGVARLEDFIEKPPPEEAPSNLASRGRYVLSHEIFEILEETRPGHGGEIQLTDGIRTLAESGDVYVLLCRAPLLDVGKKLDYLRATVEIALRRDDLKKPFSEFLRDIVGRLE
jgi:UTP--glucose-1-phosphate uridylyltransferase